LRDKERVITGYQKVMEDEGVKDKRLLVIEPEFARVLRVMGRDNNPLSAVLRQAWDTGKLRTLTKTSPAVATDAHISMIGHITVDELRRYLDRTEAANGFANRFQFCCVERSKCLPDGAEPPGDVLAKLTHTFRKVVDAARKIGEVRRDAAARDLWHDVYPSLSEGQPGLLGAVTSRAEAQAVRDQLLYALLDSSRIISRAHLEAALAAWRYYKDSAAYVFGRSMGDPVVDTIDAALRQTGEEGMERTQIRNLFSRNESKDTIDRALASLEATGRAARFERRRGPKGGRPAEVWVTMRRIPVRTTETTKTTKPSKPEGSVVSVVSVVPSVAAAPDSDSAPDDYVSFAEGGW
jgi:PAS domain-containing protein